MWGCVDIRNMSFWYQNSGVCFTGDGRWIKWRGRRVYYWTHLSFYVDVNLLLEDMNRPEVSPRWLWNDRWSVQRGSCMTSHFLVVGEQWSRENKIMHNRMNKILSCNITGNISIIWLDFKDSVFLKLGSRCFHNTVQLQEEQQTCVGYCSRRWLYMISTVQLYASPLVSCRWQTRHSRRRSAGLIWERLRQRTPRGTTTWHLKPAGFAVWNWICVL